MNWHSVGVESSEALLLKERNDTLGPGYGDRYGCGIGDGTCYGAGDGDGNGVGFSWDECSVSWGDGYDDCYGDGNGGGESAR
jgi:hypothetical protein